MTRREAIKMSGMELVKMKVYHFELPCTDDFEFDVTSIEVKRVR